MNSEWHRMMLLSAVTACCSMASTANEAPWMSRAYLPYGLLACALVALVGSAVLYAADR